MMKPIVETVMLLLYQPIKRVAKWVIKLKVSKWMIVSARLHSAAPWSGPVYPHPQPPAGLCTLYIPLPILHSVHLLELTLLSSVYSSFLLFKSTEMWFFSPCVCRANLHSGFTVFSVRMWDTRKIWTFSAPAIIPRWGLHLHLNCATVALTLVWTNWSLGMKHTLVWRRFLRVSELSVSPKTEGIQGLDFRAGKLAEHDPNTVVSFSSSE